MVPSFAMKTFLGVAFLFHQAIATYNIVDLSTQNWTLASPDHHIKVPGKVPSHAHVDLYDAHAIDDP
jgi:beta-mannosidase